MPGHHNSVWELNANNELNSLLHWVHVSFCLVMSPVQSPCSLSSTAWPVDLLRSDKQCSSKYWKEIAWKNSFGRSFTSKSSSGLESAALLALKLVTSVRHLCYHTSPVMLASSKASSCHTDSITTSSRDLPPHPTSPARVRTVIFVSGHLEG